MITQKFKNPTSLAGYGLLAIGVPDVIRGVSQIADFDEGEQVAQVAGTTLETLSSGDWFSAIFVALMGVAAIIKDEITEDKK